MGAGARLCQRGRDVFRRLGLLSKGYNLAFIKHQDTKYALRHADIRLRCVAR